VGSTPDLPEGAQKPFTWWILSALQFKPYLIEDYSADVDKERVAVQWLGSYRDDVNQRTDLIARWTRGHEEHMRAAAAYF
jgi:hypothetical protein